MSFLEGMNRELQFGKISSKPINCLVSWPHSFMIYGREKEIIVLKTIKSSIYWCSDAATEVCKLVLEGSGVKSCILHGSKPFGLKWQREMS